MILLIPALSFPYWLEFEASSTVELNWVSAAIEYHYMEIGRESRGVLNLYIENTSASALSLTGIDSPWDFRVVPSSPLELPLVIPPGMEISLMAFSEPMDGEVVLGFDRGELSIPLRVEEEYREKKREMILRRLKLMVTLAVAFLMVRMIGGMVGK